MNVYDTKIINCSECGKFIGEIDCDALVMLPKCGRCANQMSENNASILHPENIMTNNGRNGYVITN